MAIVYKIDVMKALHEKGYTCKQLEDFGLNNCNQTGLHTGRLLSWSKIDLICELLKCQPGDIVEWVDNLISTDLTKKCTVEDYYLINLDMLKEMLEESGYRKYTLRRLGISQRSIKSIWSGSFVYESTVQKLCNIFGCDPELIATKVSWHDMQEIKTTKNNGG